MRTAFLSIICTLLIGGCSRPAPAPVQAADTTPNCVQIDPIAAALAQSTTHLAVGADNSYFVQETDNELDTVYRIDSLDTSHTTTLTSAAIGAPSTVKAWVESLTPAEIFKPSPPTGTQSTFISRASRAENLFVALAGLNPRGKSIFSPTINISQPCAASATPSAFTAPR